MRFWVTLNIVRATWKYHYFTLCQPKECLLCTPLQKENIINVRYDYTIFSMLYDRGHISSLDRPFISLYILHRVQPIYHHLFPLCVFLHINMCYILPMYVKIILMYTTMPFLTLYLITFFSSFPELGFTFSFWIITVPVFIF